MDIPRYTVWWEQFKVISTNWPTPSKAVGMNITAEIKQYWEVSNPMAKRNIALSILELTNEFEKTWKKGSIFPIPKEIVGLRAAAQEQAAVASLSSHKYDYAACLAYSVGTGKFDPNLFKAEWDKINLNYKYNNLVKYTGGMNETSDSAMRIAKMKNAIGAAHHHYYAQGVSSTIDAKTLKIFMAPEFYYRGLKGAYDISLVSGILTELREFTKDAKYKDWLFVFGTVIAASYDDILVCTTCPKQGAKNFQRNGYLDFTCSTVGCLPGSIAEWRMGARIDNVALIQKGGESGDANSYAVEKEYVSHIDFRRHVSQQALNEGFAKTGYGKTAILEAWDTDRAITINNRAVNALPPTGSRDVYGGQQSRFTSERMGGSIFTIDGIKFGLEICLDHLKGRIPAGSGIQIQLVPSAGAHLQQFACVANGIAFNVDGGGNGTSNVRVNNTGGAPSASAQVNSTTGGAPGGSIVVYDTLPIPW